MLFRQMALQAGHMLSKAVAPGSRPLGALTFDGFSLVAILFRYTRAWVHVIRAFLLLASLQGCGVGRCPKLGPLALAAG